MYRGLIDHLAFVYGFICKGRGRVAEEDLQGLADGTHLVVKNAPAVLGGENTETPDDRADLAEARKMDQHIAEMVSFLTTMEII